MRCSVLTSCRARRRLGHGGEGKSRRLRRRDLLDLVVVAVHVILAEAALELAEVGLEVLLLLLLVRSLLAGPRPQQVRRHAPPLLLMLLLGRRRRHPGRRDETREDGAAAHRRRSGVVVVGEKEARQDLCGCGSALAAPLALGERGRGGGVEEMVAGQWRRYL